MPKATKAQLAKQIQALQAEMDTADTDDEVWIKGDDGVEIKVTGQRATSILGRYGHLWESGEDDDDQEEPDGEEGGEPAPNADTIFRRGKAK